MNSTLASRPFFLAMFLIAAVDAGAATIRVPGDVATIQQAINQAAAGDTVLVAPGTYHERLVFPAVSIRLVSEAGAASTVIDGSNGGSVIATSSAQDENTLIEGFTIQGGVASFGAGIDMLGGAPVIRHNRFVDNVETSGGFGAAIAGNGSSPIIEANEFSGNSCDSQFLSGVVSVVNGSSPRIFDNVFHDNACRALDLTLPQSAAPEVYNNTIVRNSGGIHIDHRITITSQSYRNNVIVGNGVGLEVVFQGADFMPDFRNNLLFANTVQYSGTADRSGVDGNIAVDPLFIDSVGNDFRLRIDSPAIDSGDASGLLYFPADFSGKQRLVDASGDGAADVDRGALEYQVLLFGDGFE